MLLTASTSQGFDIISLVSSSITYEKHNTKREREKERERERERERSSW